MRLTTAHWNGDFVLQRGGEDSAKGPSREGEDGGSVRKYTASQVVEYKIASMYYIYTTLYHCSHIHICIIAVQLYYICNPGKLKQVLVGLRVQTTRRTTCSFEERPRGLGVIPLPQPCHTQPRNSLSEQELVVDRFDERSSARFPTWEAGTSIRSGGVT